MNSYMKTMSELVEFLNVCRKKYYVENKPIISDEEYDKLFDELEALESESGIILANSPTQQVGYQIMSNLEEIKHEKPLLSLEKTKDIEGIIKFQSDKDVLYMHKLDGLTVQLTYDGGELVLAETRGDGVTGEVITHNAKQFINIPLKVPYTSRFKVTGEAIILKNDFEQINNDLDAEDKYANPRNLASGSVRQLDSFICSKRRVRFIVWNANDLSKDGTMESGLLQANSFGFDIVQYTKKGKGFNNTKQSIEKTLQNLKYYADSKFIPIDGIVIMFDDIKYGESLGRTSHHFKNGIAFKFYDEGYTTNVIGVEYTIGKTGALTPTVVFDPVQISGTTVCRASVHNISILSKLNIAIGDEVEVYKANEIIPQIRCNNTEHTDSTMYKRTVPRECPYCGEHTRYEHSPNGIVVLTCSNKYCKGILLKKLSSFVGRSGLDIEGLSEKTLEKFIYLGYLKSYSDVFTLIERYGSNIQQMSGFGTKSVEALSNSIEKCKNTTLSKLLVSLNIDNVGKQNAIVLADYYKNDANNLIVDFDTNKNHPGLYSIKSFGEVIASSIIGYFSDETNLAEFKDLCSFMKFDTQTENSGTLSGKSFVITGSLETFKNRSELVKCIEAAGGTVDSSIKTNTSYLINNDVNSTSSKNKKAKELRIPIISENQFLELLNTETKPKANRTKLF